MLSQVLRMSDSIMDFVRYRKVHALLNLAIDVFSTLANSLEKISTRCMRLANNVLHSGSQRIFDALVSLDSEKEKAILMTKFAKCNTPLLVNTSAGYPESLLHIALSSDGMLTSPLLQTFLHSGALQKQIC